MYLLDKQKANAIILALRKVKKCKSISVYYICNIILHSYILGFHRKGNFYLNASLKVSIVAL